MTYFVRNYRHLTFPVGDENQIGFRPSQVAALHALNAHFFGRTEPAIVVMPTGSGKSAVLTASPFILRASRVLVLTPSRLVREQLAENFASLVDLRKLEAMSPEARSPEVCTVGRLVASSEEWEAFRRFDVVVATVPSVSPRPGAVASPPADLFDLVLVDEAHHSPARTWAALLRILAGARQVLFTATPFRRDEGEINGRIVFRYDLKRARDDHIFGDIRFEAVHRVKDEPIDQTIARAVEKRFVEDNSAGRQHLVMVRADSLDRARQLQELYSRHTKLRLEFVRGQHSLKHVKGVLKKLESGNADGIVCVNMFGEGFNLPALKIAGIHSPHKSLAVTLQFIGRFARRVGNQVGTATFLAEPHDSNLELRGLYEAGSSWRDLVANLSDARVEEEVVAREVLDSFEVASAIPDLDDFSLYTLRLYCHAKVYRAKDVDLRAEPAFPGSVEIVFSGISDPHGAAVYVTREVGFPPWSSDDRFAEVAYDTFVFHHNAKHGFLFVCASRRQERLYQRLVEPLTLGSHIPLSSGAINRVLRDVDALTVFSLGLRVRNPLGRTESYQQRTGGHVDRTVQEVDARRYDRGHLFAKGLDRGNPVTIGVSSASKLWRNNYMSIPQLLKLFDTYADKIASSKPVRTSTRLDWVSAGDDLTSVPAGIVAMIWSEDTFADAPLVAYPNEDAEMIEAELLDFDLAVVTSEEGSCAFSISNEDFSWTGRFSIGDGPLISADGEDQAPLLVRAGGDFIAIDEYLCDALPSFYCDTLGRIEGTSMFPHRGAVGPFDIARIETIDWAAAGVDISSEKKRTATGGSLFDYVIARADALGERMVFCDDGAGEIADFITCNSVPDHPVIRFFHCKATRDPPGARQGDFHEVLNQAMRMSPWFDVERLAAQIRHRAKKKVPGFQRGGEADIRWLCSAQLRTKIQFEVYIVQPGLRRSAVTAELLELFGGVASFLHEGAVSEFRILCS